MKDPMIAVPWFIMNYLEMIVSMRRIQKFLLCDEVQPNIVVRREFNPKSKCPAIAIKGTFSWGFSEKG
jgi:hypothetical protein